MARKRKEPTPRWYDALPFGRHVANAARGAADYVANIPRNLNLNAIAQYEGSEAARQEYERLLRQDATRAQVAGFTNSPFLAESSRQHALRRFARSEVARRNSLGSARVASAGRAARRENVAANIGGAYNESLGQMRRQFDLQQRGLAPTSASSIAAMAKAAAAAKKASAAAAAAVAASAAKKAAVASKLPTPAKAASPPLLAARAPTPAFLTPAPRRRKSPAAARRAAAARVAVAAAGNAAGAAMPPLLVAARAAAIAKQDARVAARLAALARRSPGRKRSPARVDRAAAAIVVREHAQQDAVAAQLEALSSPRRRRSPSPCSAPKRRKRSPKSSPKRSKRSSCSPAKRRPAKKRSCSPKRRRT